MSAYLLGVGIICGALISWSHGPKEAPPLLARWLLRFVLALFVVFALNFFIAYGALAAIASQVLFAVLGFFAGGVTQAAGMAFFRGGIGIADNRHVVLLLICVWTALLVVVGASLRDF